MPDCVDHFLTQLVNDLSPGSGLLWVRLDSIPPAMPVPDSPRLPPTLRVCRYSTRSLAASSGFTNSASGLRISSGMSMSAEFSIRAQGVPAVSEILGQP